MTGRDLGQDAPDAAGVLELHLDQAPGLRCWLPHDRDSDRGQPGVLGVNIATWIPIITGRPGGGLRRTRAVPPIGAAIVSRKLVSCGMQIRSIWRCSER